MNSSSNARPTARTTAAPRHAKGAAPADAGASGTEAAPSPADGNAPTPSPAHASAHAPAPAHASAPAGGRNRRALACAFGLGCALSLTLAGMAWSLGVVSRLRAASFIGEWAPAAFLAAVLVLIAFSTAVAYLLLARGIPRLVLWGERLDTRNWAPRLRLSWSAPSIALATLIVLVCWTPWIILQYPCAMNGDTYNQLYQFQTAAPTLYTTLGVYVDAEFIDHHPVFDTLVFGAFLSLGDALGSQNAGLFAYSLVANVLTAASLVLSVCYLSRLGVPKVFRLVALGFVALFPMFPLWASDMVKDSLHTPFFLLFLVAYAEVVRTRGGALAKPGWVAALAVTALLSILTKKTGVYLVILALVPLFFIYRRQWKGLLIALLAPVLAYFLLFQSLVFPLIGGVAPGGSQELLGILYQQVVTVAAEDPDALAPWEREAVEGVLALDGAVEAYDPAIVDPVKNRAREDAGLSEKIEFAKAYLSIGARHPLAYLKSVVAVCASLLAPGKAYLPDLSPLQEDSWVARFAEAENADTLSLTFSKPEPIASWAAAVDEFYRAQAETNPLVMLFFSRGFYGGWIPFIALACCLYANRRQTLALWPVVIAMLVLVASPASPSRYTLPMLYATPLMLGLACGSFVTMLRAYAPVMRKSRMSPSSNTVSKPGVSPVTD